MGACLGVAYGAIGVMALYTGPTATAAAGLYGILDGIVATMAYREMQNIRCSKD